jgi:putative hemolysin
MTEARTTSAATAETRPRATIVVVWSDGKAATTRKILAHLDFKRGPWAIAKPRSGPSHPICTTLPVCHTKEAAQSWLEQGHGLVWLIEGTRADLQERQLMRLASATRASLLPIYLPGASEADARLGSVVTHDAFQRMDTERRRLQLLKWRGQALRYRQPTSSAAAVYAASEPVAEGFSRDELDAELAVLPERCHVVGNNEIDVYAARAEHIPKLLREIGRQREVTFRAAGEGTGRAVDLDSFDHTYLHLFAYNKKQRELMGAYRLGLTDELLRDQGLSGLYSSTLFKYAPDLFDKLGPTLELGRSFVCPAYQKTSRTLLWLWKGIASFVASHPRYRTLLGPVSVSAEYVNFSRELMVRVLSGSTHRHPLHRSVRAKNPVRARSFGAGGLGDPRAVLTTPSDLSAVVSDAEVDGKGLPVLLREYLKLGGKFLGFNLDHEFSNVIDGLVVVDLMQTDRRVLQFYMGRSPLDAFVDHHTARDAIKVSA